MMGNNADAVAGTSDEAKLIEELVKLKLTDPQMTNKELADKLEIPLKNCRQLIKKLRKLEEAEQGAVKSSDKKTTNPMSSPKTELLKGTLVELVNLKSKPELNGRTGLFGSYSSWLSRLGTNRDLQPWCMPPASNT